MLLDFWADWCPHCRDEFATLHEINEQYGRRGLKIIGINADTDREKALLAVKQHELAYPHVFSGEGAGNSVYQMYEITGIPSTFLLDRDLRVIAKDLRGSSLKERLQVLFP